MDTNKQKLAATDTPRGTEPIAPACHATHEKRSRSAFWQALFWGSAYAVWGYAAGGVLLPFGARPFGVALLCGSDRRVLYLYAGLCLGAWQSEERWVLLGVYTALLLLRLLIRFTLDVPWGKAEQAALGEKTLGEVYPHLFSEHLALRTASASVGAFALGFYRLAEGGYLYYDLYGTILSSLAAPLFVLLISGFFESGATARARRLVGFLSLAALLIRATRGITVWGVSPAALGCMMITLLLTRKRGLLTGVIGGTVCGLFLSPSLAPLFAFAAIAFGLFAPFSRALAIAVAFSVGMAWAVYVDGIGVLNGLLGGVLTATILFWVIDPLLLTEKGEESAEASEMPDTPLPCHALDDTALYEIRLSDTNQAVKGLCEGFTSLSEICRGLGRTMQTPTVADLRQICDNAFDSACISCPERPLCWGERYHATSTEIASLCATLHRQGGLSEADVAEELRGRCHRLPDILEEIRHHAAIHQRQILQENRAEIFAADYRALAELLSAAMARREGEYEVDRALSEMLREALDGLSLGGLGVIAWGSKRKRIRVVAEDRALLMREWERITEAVRSVCPFPLSVGRTEEGDPPCMELWEAERLAVSYTRRTLCADGEGDCCGDTTALFSTSDGRFFALISDGMGSGQEAATTSGISALFLQKLLGAGCTCHAALEILNGFLRHRSGGGSLHECSATVDLMELDLLHSRASFYKCGAAPTYVFRNGSLLKLRSHTVPIGIIGEPDTRRLGLDVSDGDVIVMISDGVTQGKEECPWLFDLLRTHAERTDPERLADLIVKYAKGEGVSDDISVLIIPIKQA